MKERTAKERIKKIESDIKHMKRILNKPENDFERGAKLALNRALQIVKDSAK